jgi:tetratricopeptide (TPR) repeat protein
MKALSKQLNEIYKNRINKNIELYKDNIPDLLNYHILNVAEFDDINSILYLGQYYYLNFIKEYNKFVKIRKILSDSDNILLVNIINKYISNNLTKINQAIKYYTKGVKFNNYECIKKLAKIYNIIFNIYFCKASISLYNINESICNNLIKYNEMCNTEYNYYNLGNCYKYMKNEEKMIENYLKANTGNSYFELSDYYYKQKNLALSIKYLYKSSLFKYTIATQLLKMTILFEQNKINLYNILINLENPNNFINNNINELIETTEIKKHIKRLEDSKTNNIIKECIICFDNKLNIKLDCGHELCVDCYNKTNNKCYYRC